MYKQVSGLFFIINQIGSLCAAVHVAFLDPTANGKPPIKQTKNNKMDSIKCTNKFPACFPLIKEPTVRRRPCRLLDPTAHGEQSRMYELSTYMLASMVLGRTGGL